MPRLARAVLAGAPHHITQRGNRGELIFFSDVDRQLYLQWLQLYCEKHDVEILAYCLMMNHVHLLAVPMSENGLHQVLKPLNARYAQHINRRLILRGHLWQGRFFSSVLDEPYMWAAIRYVERNPVRAKIVDRAEKYLWSSAAAHCGLRSDPVITQKKEWIELIEQNTDDWSDWLTLGDEKKVKIIKRNIHNGLPCGAQSFINKLEKQLGRDFKYRPPHRPKKHK